MMGQTKRNMSRHNKKTVIKEQSYANKPGQTHTNDPVARRFVWADCACKKAKKSEHVANDF